MKDNVFKKSASNANTSESSPDQNISPLNLHNISLKEKSGNYPNHPKRSFAEKNAVSSQKLQTLPLVKAMLLVVCYPT